MFTSSFDKAFNLIMTFEVGSWFDPTDSSVISGDISSKENKRKVGYVNHPTDPGGETKFGIAKTYNNIDIASLTLSQAKQIYYDKYWLTSRSSELLGCVSELHFDAAVNHGTGRAAKFLQQSCGAVVDGSVGPNTIKKANAINPIELANKYLDVRDEFYRNLVERKPKMHIFLTGWLNRTTKLRDNIQ